MNKQAYPHNGHLQIIKLHFSDSISFLNQTPNFTDRLTYKEGNYYNNKIVT